MIFDLYQTHGLPFSVTLSILKDRGIKPDYYQLCLDASKHWTKKTLMARLGEAVVDVYGKAEWKVLSEKVEKLK